MFILSLLGGLLQVLRRTAGLLPLAAAVAAGAQGPAVEPVPSQARPAVEQTEPSPSVELDVLSPDFDPLAVTPEMEAFLDRHIDPLMQREARLRRLQEAIFDPNSGLGIVYGAHGTYSAAETFEKGAGNCLSFTLLFVSLARELGFVVHFVEVDEVTGWSRFGEVSFNHWHMFADVELANGIVQVDFLPYEERRYRSRQRIGEDRMKAHFYNNLGAQSLTRQQDIDRAEVLFQRALEHDPTFMPAQINLSVAERRLGRLDSAEARLLAVLKKYPRNEQAASNLANLYSAQQRDDAANEWIKRRNRFQRQNPFHHFRLGMTSLAAGDPGMALEHFRRAVARQSDEAVFHEQMAEAYLQLGLYRKARSSLLRALDHSTEETKADLEAKLDRLTSVRPPG